MAWDRVDIARSEILNGDVEWKVPPDSGQLRAGTRGGLGQVASGSILGQLWLCGPGETGAPPAAASLVCPPRQDGLNCGRCGPSGTGAAGQAGALPRVPTPRPTGSLSPSAQSRHLEEVMMDALVSNKPQFVRLFVDGGADVADVVTYGRLRQLYRSAPPKSLPFHLLRRKREEGRLTLAGLGASRPGSRPPSPCTRCRGCSRTSCATPAVGSSRR